MRTWEHGSAGGPAGRLDGSATRRVRAARIARLLVPLGTAVGGFVSTELRVALADGAVGRPAVALASGDPPEDGRLTTAPELVVVLGPAAAAQAASSRWLAAGSDAVWWAGESHARQYTAAGAAVRRHGELLTVPGLDEIAVRVEAFLA